jgi:hypothetical protein
MDHTQGIWFLSAHLTLLEVVDNQNTQNDGRRIIQGNETNSDSEQYLEQEAVSDQDSIEMDGSLISDDEDQKNNKIR